MQISLKSRSYDYIHSLSIGTVTNVISYDVNLNKVVIPVESFLSVNSSQLSLKKIYNGTVDTIEFKNFKTSDNGPPKNLQITVNACMGNKEIKRNKRNLF